MRNIIKKNYVLGIIIIFICLEFYFGADYYNKYYHKNVKSHPVMYCYQTYWGPVNSVLIIEDLEYKDALIKYYNQIEKDTCSNPSIGVPLKTLPQYEPVYVIGYTKDSLLAEVVCYYNYGARRGGWFTKGWVYVKCLHNNPPAKFCKPSK